MRLVGITPDFLAGPFGLSLAMSCIVVSLSIPICLPLSLSLSLSLFLCLALVAFILVYFVDLHTCYLFHFPVFDTARLALLFELQETFLVSRTECLEFLLLLPFGHVRTDPKI